MSIEANKVLKEAKSHLGLRGRPNLATKWYAARHGDAFLRAAWCDMFASWVGARTGLGKKIGEFAYCPSHVNWFKKEKRWGSKPRVGAVVFFDWDNDGVADHVGFVEAHKAGTVTTLEGNTSDAVRRRVRYPKDILGYGYPPYAADPAPAKPAAPRVTPYPGRLIQEGSKGSAVVKVQKALIKAGVKLPRYGADGSFGGETESAVKTYQRRNKLAADGVVGPKTWGKLF